MDPTTGPAPSARRARASSFLWVGILGAVDLFAWADATVALHDHHPAFAAVFAYPAFSLLVVTLMYARTTRGANPGPWLKGERGPWLQPVFWPYRAVAYTLTILARVVRLHTVSAITPSLYLGARLMPKDAPRLEAVGVRYVVDLCAECPTNARLASPPFERLGVPVLDRCPPTLAELDRAVDWIVARIGSGGRVYVHCAFGRGRSAVVAAAALVGLGLARDAGEALAVLKRQRPSVRLNSSQRGALEAWVAARAGRKPA